MKKLIFLAAFVCSMWTVQTVEAQNPITTLEHAGNTTVFYGLNSLVDAYTASVNGDALYLSTGYFTSPTSITKGIKIIGAGHFPDSVNVAKRTFIQGGLTINAGADSLRLEGMYINGNINYAAASSINYVKVIRCRLGNANFQSNSPAASKNYCSYEECFIEGSIDYSYYGVNLLISHSIISGQIYNIENTALIDGNIILYNSCPYYCYAALNSIKSSVIRNNIFIITSGSYLQGNCNGNIFHNNIILPNSVDYGINSNNNNYPNIAQANIFVNQTGYSINYTHDYHLKNAATLVLTVHRSVYMAQRHPLKTKAYLRILRFSPKQ